ncbi:uncharacterized protein FN964_000645 isoform 1-T1 [Alca torda]
MAPPSWIAGGLIQKVLAPYADFCKNLHALYREHIVIFLDRGWSAHCTVRQSLPGGVCPNRCFGFKILRIEVQTVDIQKKTIHWGQGERAALPSKEVTGNMPMLMQGLLLSLKLFQSCSLTKNTACSSEKLNYELQVPSQALSQRSAPRCLLTQGPFTRALPTSTSSTSPSAPGCIDGR